MISRISRVVTDEQLGNPGKMAEEKGVDWQSFEAGLDNGTLATVLRAMKLGKRIRIVPEIEPPAGGQICTLRIPVVIDRRWQEAVNAAGPHAPDNYNVRKVGDFYLPTGLGLVVSEIILMNFGPAGGNWKRAINWAEQYLLKRTDPRRVFAIGEHKPNLHRELGIDPMYVVATEECSFQGDEQACFVCWYGDARGAGLGGVWEVGGPRGWFAFDSE